MISRSPNIETNPKHPSYIIHSLAPIRICDNGGWTDTWFAEHGEIFNIGVSPYAEVKIVVYESNRAPAQFIINAQNYGDRYQYHPDSGWYKHPLIEATLSYMQIPENLSLEVNIFSGAPPGASTGTSAAITVALIGALDGLTNGRLTPQEIASTAHKIETEILGQQSGIQDQICSAYGGINFINMHQYPEATVNQISVSDDIKRKLEQQLVLLYLGKSHSSSNIHELVIHSLEDAGPNCDQLNDLRLTARKSRDALLENDLAGFGSVMVENTNAQRRLHPGIIGVDASKVIKIAKRYNALGWKINGAGGEGGSITILCNDQLEINQQMIREIEAKDERYRNIPVKLSTHGLRIKIIQNP